SRLAWSWVDPDPAKIVYGNEVRALVLAKRLVAAATGADRAPYRDTLAWAMYRCGRFDDALAEEARAVEEVTEELSGELETWQEKLRAQVALWTRPDARARGLDEERALSMRMADLGGRTRQRRTFEFEDAQDRWWFGQLSQLVSDLDAFADEK